MSSATLRRSSALLPLEMACSTQLSARISSSTARSAARTAEICDDVDTIAVHLDHAGETADLTLAKLHSLGLKIIMATGDNEATAKAVAARLGIDEVRAGLRPEDKLTLIAGEQQKGHVVAMAG